MTSNNYIYPASAGARLQIISSCPASPRSPLLPFSTRPVPVSTQPARSEPPSIDPDPCSKSARMIATNEPPCTTLQDPFIASIPMLTHGSTSQEKPHHIKRPPNAFMLFRSDFIRKRTIPRDVEKRQQNLSRIAGQCWKLMSAEDKAIWHEKSAALTAAHYAKYPDYKFRPTRKSTVKRGGKGTDKQSHSCDYRGDNESLTRTRSETVEPCVGPVRSARSRARKSPCDEGTLSQLRGSITSPSSASLSLSPLSLTSELPPPASQDQIPTAGPSNDTQLSAFVDPVQRLLRLDPNPSDKSLGCSLGVTFSDAVQDLNITPNEFRVLSQRCQTTQVVCFCGEQHPIPPALYHSYTPLLSSSTVTPSVYRGVNIDLIHSSGVPDGTFGYPYDGLQPYFGTLFSWL